EAFNLECEVLTPAQAADRYPLLETADLQGALWLPLDGTANPTDVTQALARGARMRGAQVHERTRVTGVATRDGAISGVQTDRGDIETEIVVNCAGQWAKAIGAMIGVNVPLHSAEHFYVVTDQIDGVDRMLPILRDPDGYTYMKEEVGGLVVGGFEPVAKPWVAPDRIPHPFEFQLLDEDWEHFEILMESALHRVPVLQQTGIKKFYNGPESFTPDNQFILGEAAEVRNFFVAAGFNSVGIASAGGAGRALAQWIAAGEPQSDLVAVDIRRFASFNANNQWLHDRVGEVLGLHYAIPWPNREFQTARPFRRSPVHELVERAGASFGSRMGWERPNFFAPHGTSPAIEYSWERQNWMPWVDAEQVATRTGVALYDQTSFGKLLVHGRDAEEVLQWLCTNNVAISIGRTVYTGVLNARGTYEADVTLTRLAEDEYLWVTSSASAVRDRDWIRRHVRPERHVEVADVSSSLAVLGVMGPSSRELLQSLSRADFDDFPFASSREVDLGYCTVRATRITYVGELGWELYVPAEFAVSVFTMLHESGARLGVANAGYYAINALRLEKGYRAFGTELTPDYNPVEAGLLFAVKLRTDIPFLGRDAVEAAKANGVRRRLVSFTLDDPAVMMWGGELVLRDGLGSGQVTSAAFGTTVGSCVGLAYVWRRDGGVVTDDYVSEGRWSMNVSGRIVDASVQLSAPYDPKSERIRS
ncbi:MAG: FAD-dependent oxidoreductase, partial [bacterium]|nr:FAD-dependent oxidoreductase [bacterium]